MYKCPKENCGWMYENLTALRTHCNRQHGMCTRGLEDISRVRNGEHINHEENNKTLPRKCPLCGRSKDDEDHIENHSDLMFKCPKCGWMYENLNAL